MKYTIRKNISRKINTGSYENIVVSVDIEKEIDCDEKKLKSHSKNLSMELIEDFKETISQVMSELGLEEKKAWGESKPSKCEAPSNEEMKNIFGE
jgi:hypothetical protein